MSSDLTPKYGIPSLRGFLSPFLEIRPALHVLPFELDELGVLEVRWAEVSHEGDLGDDGSGDIQETAVLTQEFDCRLPAREQAATHRRVEPSGSDLGSMAISTKSSFRKPWRRSSNGPDVTLR